MSMVQSEVKVIINKHKSGMRIKSCLLYTSDAADE